MTKRVIKTTVGTYVGKRGGQPFVGAVGWQGDEVDVHEDYLEEFDAVNVENGDGKPVEYERVGVDVISPKVVEADRKAAAKAAEESDEEEEEPKSTARKAPAKK